MIESGVGHRRWLYHRQTMKMPGGAGLRTMLIAPLRALWIIITEDPLFAKYISDTVGP